MKFSRILFASALVMSAIAFNSCADKPAAPAVADNTPAILKGVATLNVDGTASKLMWKGDMLGLYSHEGLITISNGSLNVKDGAITGGTFTIDMNTITPTDNGYDAEHKKEDLVGHLSGNDFFDVANNPTATFAISSITGNTGKGTLTVRGISNEETIENVVIAAEGTDAVKVTGTVKFDRKKYNVNFDMPVKDKVLSNEIVMNVELIAKK